MMRRRDLLGTGALGMGVLVLAGCGVGSGPAVSDEATDHLTTIRAAGAMVFGTEGTWAPETYHDESDELVGYDVDVARAVSAKRGVEAEFAEGEWDGLFAGMDGRHHDSVANGVDVTEERAEKYDFTHALLLYPHGAYRGERQRRDRLVRGPRRQADRQHRLEHLRADGRELRRGQQWRGRLRPDHLAARRHERRNR